MEIRVNKKGAKLRLSYKTKMAEVLNKTGGAEDDEEWLYGGKIYLKSYSDTLNQRPGYMFEYCIIILPARF